MTPNSIGGSKFYPITKHLLLALALLARLESRLVLADPNQIKANLLDGAGFRLEAKAQFWPESFDKPPRQMRVSHVEFSETYTPKSKRAKIVQRLHGRPPRKYFLAGGEPKLVKLAAQKIPEHQMEVTRCEQIERNNLIEDLFEVEGNSKELAINWLANGDATPDYLLGMAQLLLQFDSNRDRLKPIRDMQRIREFPCQRYDLEWKLGQLDLTLSAYLGDKTLTFNGALLPLRIWVKTKTRGLMMVDFYSVEALPELPRLEELSYHVEPTTVDLGYGCYANSTLERSYPKFHEIFSMHFEVVDKWNSPIRREFVALDGRQQAFRRESVAVSDGMEFRKTITIYDLRHNIKFINRFAPMTKSHDFLDARMSDRCIGVPTWLPGDRPFMPFDRFVKMGTGIVRGVQVVIMEHVSKKAPEIFLPSARYLSEGDGGLIQSRFVNILPGGLNRAGPFSIVYYFELQSSPKDRLALGRLVRADLMSNGRLLVQVNVYKFFWQLTDAPNGDRREQLFRIPGVCYDGQSSNTASRSLQLELEYQAATSSHITEQVALEVIESVPVRSVGLLRSLSEQVEEISITRVSNIESVLRRSQTFGEHFKLFVDVELALGHQISHPYQPVLATRVTVFAGQEPIGHVTSYEECLYEAALRYGRDRRQEVLFAFIEDAHCYIDSKPIYETSKLGNTTNGIDFTYSNVFRLNRSPSGGSPAMRIIQMDAGRILNELKPRQVASKIVDDLTGRRLIMPIVDARNPELLLDSLLFKIEAISVTGRQSSSDQHKAKLLKDLAFINSRALRKQTGSDVLDQQSCQTACLADLNCRSYSICARDRTIDCRLSELDFDDEKLLIQLDRKRKEVTQAKRHQIDLDYQPASAEEPAGGNSKQASRHVELILDKRCQIYTNRAVDMFEEVSKALTQVSSNYLNEVDNVEECARLCLEENINYFKKYQNFTLFGTETSDKESIRKHYAKALKEWCSTFRYVDLRTSSIAHDAFSKFKKGGVCQYSRGLRNGSDDGLSDATTAAISVEVDIFEFKHVNLYTAHSNLVMKPYYPDSDSPNRPANKRRISHMMTLEDCARACFSQTTELVPYCKSFEYIIAKLPTSGAMEESTRASIITQCAFNTMSIDDAIASDHYDKIVETRQDSSIVSSNHYEPLKAYLLDPQFMDKLTEDSTPEIRSDTVETVDVLSGLAIIVIALISGLYIGVRLERPIIDYWIILREKKADSRRFQRFSGENS